MPPSRFLHVMGVVHRALDLCSCTQADPERALLAAALHDIGKGMEPEAMRARLREWGADVPPEDEAYPQLWHAWYGREAARREFGIEDPLILDAVAYHPTGRAAMTPVDATLFVADFLEPLREFDPVQPVDEIARASLPRALFAVLDEKIGYVERKGQAVHPRALEAREYYRKFLK